MKFVLVLFLFGVHGPFTQSQPFDSLKACEVERVKVQPAIAKANGEAVISHFAAACLPVKKAPAGKPV